MRQVSFIKMYSPPKFPRLQVAQIKVDKKHKSMNRNIKYDALCLKINNLRYCEN